MTIEETIRQIVREEIAALNVDMKSIHDLRIEAGLEQRQLAKLSKVGLSTISKAETGKTKMQRRQLERIARVLNVKPENIR